MRLTFSPIARSAAADQVTASTLTRTLAGPVVEYGTYGRTSGGTLRVAPGALRFPDDLGRVKLTREHDRADARGHLVTIEDDGTVVRAALRVSDGPEGDAALREAADRTRDGFSFDVVDAVVEGDTITSALVIAIGQVGIPAFDDMRIDTIAASQEGSPTMTEEQRARLAALRAQDSRTAAEQAELDQLVAAEAADATAGDQGNDSAPAATPNPAPAAGADTTTVAASTPAVPGSVPAPTSTTTTRPRGTALARLVSEVTAGLRTRSTAAITAALEDIIHTDHTENIEPPAWSGELWSGLQYVPEWSDLFASGTLTNWEGRGWRFTQKLAIDDYAGDKTEIPTGNVATEPSTYEAARMAVGVDVDRKFYDFPNQGFVNGLFEQVRESWAIQLDAKVRAYALDNAVPVLDPSDDPIVAPSLLKAAARASMALKRRRVGRASWIVVNDEDMFTLLDYREKDVPAFLDLWGINPRDFRSSPDVPEGTVLAGVRPAAVVRTLPGSPIRVDAQNIANGGIDTGFFGYWAIETHHTEGVASVQYEAPVVEDPEG